MAEEEADYSQLPLTERFVHKNWKVRKEGYEAAVKAFETTPDESDPIFAPFDFDSSLWKAVAGDSNVAAQQEGLAALCAYLKYGSKQGATRSRSYAVTPIYEKGLTQTRPAAKAAALEALLLYIEADKPDAVIDELIPALSHKQPKVAAATLNAITQIYHNFGVRVVEPKVVLKALPKVYAHADKNVRAEGQALTVELYRWLKDAMKPIFWDELKPVQQQDLEKLFEKVKEEPAPKQERWTRAQQAQMASAKAAPTTTEVDGDNDEGEHIMEEDPVEVDAFDLAEPVDACAKVPASFQDNMASAKWKDRKDALDELLTIVNVPRLKDGPYDDIIRALAKSMKDANIAVVTVAANCVEKIALGLRKPFAKYRSTILAPMMERLKEKKQSVADALGAALDGVFVATSLSDNLPEILGFLTNKNPNVKGETIKFLSRCLRTTRDVPSKDEQKQIAEAGTKLLTESTEQMRSGGAEILGVLMKIIGERAFGPYLDGLDEIRKTRIKEFFDTAEVKAKEKPKPVAVAKAPPQSAASKKVVSGGKKLATKKVGAISAAPIMPEEPTPIPAVTAKQAPRPLARPGVASRPGAATATGARLGGLKKPATSTSSSPQRRLISPALSQPEDEEATVPSPSKFGIGRGGLTARPLSKPTMPPSPPRHTSGDHGLSIIERTELEDLRIERDRLLALTESLKNSNTKLITEITELQNQNAQLIEDHTRDVLQIKAKETQLVRARGECDVLRAEIDNTRQEGERYKREVSRLSRESIGRDRDEFMRAGHHDEVHDANGFHDDATRAPYHAPYLNNSRPGSAALHRTESAMSNGSRRAAKYTPTTCTSGEEKENSPESASQTAVRRKISPPMVTRSPQRSHPGMSREQSGNSVSATSNGESGGESWKRAAEVTSQLKARIEAMKVELYGVGQTRSILLTRTGTTRTY